MTTISFPGPEFPAYPEMTIDCPEGWSPIAGAGYPLAVGLDGTGPDEYQPNVVVTVTRMPRRATLDQVIDHVVETVSAADEVSEIHRGETEVAGHPGFRMEATYTHPHGGRVTQAVQVCWYDHDDVFDMVQSIGACGSDRADDLRGSIRDIQDSVALG